MLEINKSSIGFTDLDQLLLSMRKHDKDVGSAQVQIISKTARVRKLNEHLRANKKDHPVSRRLVQLVSEIKTLMKFLQKDNSSLYTQLNQALKSHRK